MIEVIKTHGGKGQDMNIEVFGDVLYSLIRVHSTIAYFETIVMNPNLYTFLKREFKGVSELALIKELLNCKILLNNTIGNMIKTKPCFNNTEVHILIDEERWWCRK